MLEELLKALQANTAALEANTAARANGTSAAAVVEEDEDLLGGGDEEKITQTQVIDAVKAAAERNKEKTKAVLAAFKVKRASEIPEAEWAKAIVALEKVKK